MAAMKKRSVILTHLLFWIYMLNQSLFPYYMSKVSEEYSYEIGIHLFSGLISFYSLYLLLPLLLKFRRKIFTVLLVILLVGPVLFVKLKVEYYLWIWIGGMDAKDFAITRDWVLNDLRLTIIYFMYAFLIRLTIGWFDTQKLRTELKTQTQASELALLRSQVNPHFLFNTLNNIYSLVYKKSDDAPEAVMKMSAIMRYMLYDATSDKVPLEKEVEYLKSFIELEKLRIRHKDFVDLNIVGNLDNHTIAPMLMIPFVENAFKHGSKNVTTPGIRINLFAEPSRILFEVTNYLRPGTPGMKDVIGGIGLQNVRRRLALLYPGKHELDVIREETMFRIKLIISN
jgi:two-component sensor histidine kinase